MRSLSSVIKTFFDSAYPLSGLQRVRKFYFIALLSLGVFSFIIFGVGQFVVNGPQALSTPVFWFSIVFSTVIIIIGIAGSLIQYKSKEVPTPYSNDGSM